MDFSLQAGETIMTWDPLRKVDPPPSPAGPGRLRIGPDWTTLAGNWYTKWERTGDEQWLDMIKIGMVRLFHVTHPLHMLRRVFRRTLVDFSSASLLEMLLLSDGMPLRRIWLMRVVLSEGRQPHISLPSVHFTSRYSLVMIFGGGEFLMEAMDVIDDQPEFDAAWIDFCRLYNASDAE
jgi:hypothetical protein